MSDSIAALLRGPYSDFTEHEAYHGYDLYGRFILRTEEGREVLYQVSAERGDPPTLVIVNCTAYPPRVAHITDDELKRQMQDRAFAEAKRRVDASDFENGGTYAVPF